LRGEKSLRDKIRAAKRDPQRAVHDLRVAVKILRAGLRYFDPGLKRYRPLDRAMRARSRKLAPVREREARREVLSWLEKKGIRLGPAQGEMRAPRPLSPREIDRVADLRRHAKNILPGLRKKSAHEGEVHWRALRRALAACSERPSLRRLHEVRKKAKRLEYQLRYFARRKDLRRVDLESLRKAGEELGRVRDLALLARHLGARQALSRVQGELEKRAFARLRRLVNRH